MPKNLGEGGILKTQSKDKNQNKNQGDPRARLTAKNKARRAKVKYGG